MKKSTYIPVAILLAVASFLGGAWWAHRDPVPATQQMQQQKIAQYACPMHPEYRSDRPGDCPSCGMRLEPVRTGNTTPTAAAGALPPGAVPVSAEQQQA